MTVYRKSLPEHGWTGGTRRGGAPVALIGAVALVTTLIGLVFALGYFYRASLLYGATVPVALPLALACVALGLTIAVPAALRGQAEQRERERDRAHIDGAFEHAALGIALVAPDGRWLRVNRAMCEIVGYSEGELLATTFQALTHPDDVDADVALVHRMLAGEIQTYQMEKRYYHRQGHVIWALLSVSLSRDADDVPRYFISQVQDITERVQAERALRRAHGTVAALLEAAPLAVLAIDLENRVTMWNPGAERLFGWTADEVIGKPLPVVSDDYLPEYTQRVEEVLRGRRVSGVETRRRRKDGMLVDVLLSTAPLQDGTGSTNGLVALLLDVTERRELEEQLRQSQRLEAVGQLAGGVAHDFNNLLTVITSYAALLLEDLGESHPRRKDIQEIAKAADRATSLTQQLLAFGRRQMLQPRVLDVNHTVTELERMLRRLVTADIELVTVLDPGLRTVRADPGQLEQVLMNLVVNARDAMPDGGTITIETTNVEIDAGSAARHGSPEQPGAYVRLAVTDTGHGMDPGTLAHIFEPFFTTKEPGKGTGLGLSTVYGIVTQSGGAVSCSSEPGRGTTFQIHLPHADGRADGLGSRERAGTPGHLLHSV